MEIENLLPSVLRWSLPTAAILAALLTLKERRQKKGIFFWLLAIAVFLFLISFLAEPFLPPVAQWSAKAIIPLGLVGIVTFLLIGINILLVIIRKRGRRDLHFWVSLYALAGLLLYLLLGERRSAGFTIITLLILAIIFFFKYILQKIKLKELHLEAKPILVGGAVGVFIGIFYAYLLVVFIGADRFLAISESLPGQILILTSIFLTSGLTAASRAEQSLALHAFLSMIPAWLFWRLGGEIGTVGENIDNILTVLTLMIFAALLSGLAVTFFRKRTLH